MVVALVKIAISRRENIRKFDSAKLRLQILTNRGELNMGETVKRQKLYGYMTANHLTAHALAKQCGVSKDVIKKLIYTEGKCQAMIVNKINKACNQKLLDETDIVNRHGETRTRFKNKCIVEGCDCTTFTSTHCLKHYREMQDQYRN